MEFNKLPVKRRESTWKALIVFLKKNNEERLALPEMKTYDKIVIFKSVVWIQK